MNKLGAKATTGATALSLFHRYNLGAGPDSTYDRYLIACSCIYLSGKAENDHQKLRDVINVTQTTLKKMNEPLDLGDEYYAIREAIVQAELLLLRMINFKVQVEHPHKYLLHYLKSLKGIYYRLAPFVHLKIINYFDMDSQFFHKFQMAKDNGQFFVKYLQPLNQQNSLYET